MNHIFFYNDNNCVASPTRQEEGAAPALSAPLCPGDAHNQGRGPNCFRASCTSPMQWVRPRLVGSPARPPGRVLKGPCTAALNPLPHTSSLLSLLAAHMLAGHQRGEKRKFIHHLLLPLNFLSFLFPFCFRFNL